jgi:hypothetical protein
MANTGIACPDCGADIGIGNPDCPNCRPHPWDCQCDDCAGEMEGWDPEISVDTTDSRGYSETVSTRQGGRES